MSLVRSKKHLELPSANFDGFESDDDDDYCEVLGCDLAPEGTYPQLGMTSSPFMIAGIVLLSSCAKSRSQTVAEAIAREDRMEVVYDIWERARYKELEDCYERLVEERLLAIHDPQTLPNRYDGARIWRNLAWRNSSRRLVDYDVFLEDVEDTYENDIYNYKRIVRKALAALIPRPKDRRDVTERQRYKFPGLVLDMPIALFTCVECGKCGLPWPDINGHWREAHPKKSIWMDKDSRRLNIRWWRRGADTASQLLRAASLEGMRHILQLDMYISSRRLNCNCSDPTLNQPPKLTWPELVSMAVTSRLESVSE